MTEDKLIYHFNHSKIIIIVDIPLSKDIGEAMDNADIEFKNANIIMPKKLGYVDWVPKDD